jgi:hypothetical protein|tara:strand:- start:2986 stop:3219 length:234 start_codon:yes stop_codon:yes gene_type:complete
MKKLEQDELDKLKDLMRDHNDCKVKLGETVLLQQSLMTQVAMIKKESKAYEELLISKYGEDSTINIETGEVKPSKKE